MMVCNGQQSAMTKKIVAALGDFCQHVPDPAPNKASEAASPRASPRPLLLS
jgi:hypothetical protein